MRRQPQLTSVWSKDFSSPTSWETSTPKPKLYCIVLIPRRRYPSVPATCKTGIGEPRDWRFWHLNSTFVQTALHCIPSLTKSSHRNRLPWVSRIFWSQLVSLYHINHVQSIRLIDSGLVLLLTIGTLINYRPSEPAINQSDENSPLLGNQRPFPEPEKDEKWYHRLLPNNTPFREYLTSRFLNHFPFLIEIIYWNLVYWPYQLSRALSAVIIRNNASIFASSRSHALSILRFERCLHLSLEQPLQSWILNKCPNLMKVLAVIYYSHIILSIIFIVYTYTYLPRASYQKIRRAMAVCNIIAFSILSVYRVMPPRLLPHSQGFVDVLHPSQGEKSVWTDNKFQLTIAAMPSEHFGMASLISYSLTRYSPHTWLRIIAPLWSLVMLFTIVATANHYLLDAFVGGLVTVLAFWGNRAMLVLRPVEEWVFWVVRTEKPRTNDVDPPKVKRWGAFMRESWR